MRISDWSSDVCSSDLVIDGVAANFQPPQRECSIAALKPAVAAARNDAAWGGFDETASSGLCFTSGTTGAPKGVTYTHRSSYLPTLRLLQADEIGRASCRERGCQYV